MLRHLLIVTAATALASATLAGPSYAQTATPTRQGPALAAETALSFVQEIPDLEGATLEEIGIDPADPALEEGVSIGHGLDVILGGERVGSAEPGSSIAPQAIGGTVPSGHCHGRIDHPHYSKGAGGAVAKVYVSCTSRKYKSFSVRIQGLLQFTAGGMNPLVTRARSDQTQQVPVGGKEVPFYIPRAKDGHGGTGAGTWVTTATIWIVGPETSNPASDTVAVKKTILPPGMA